MSMPVTLDKVSMRNLESLGLDASDASMCWIGDAKTAVIPPSEGLIESEQARWHDGCEIIPAYTFQDLLRNLTPSEGHSVIECDPNEWINMAYNYLVWRLSHGKSLMDEEDYHNEQRIC